VRPLALAGDSNVVPTDLDIYATKSWDRNALLQPQSRAANQRLLAQGWIDATRALIPKKPMYTFWDYMRKRWERDGGLGLDHVLLSPVLTKRLQVPASIASGPDDKATAALALLLPPVPRARRGRARGLSSRCRHRIVHMPSAI
jgi:exonuclease III